MKHPFTNPFRYVPHPLVRKAAGIVMDRLDRLISSAALPEAVCRGFSEGKMLGVLVCSCDEEDNSTILEHMTDTEYGRCRFIAAFSGSVGGKSIVEGFVPPIYDLLNPSGYFKEKEAEISALSEKIAQLEDGIRFPMMVLDNSISDRDKALSVMMERKSRLRMQREILRKGWDADGTMSYEYRERLIRESQHENAEYKREKDRWKGIIEPIEKEIREMKDEIRTLKQKRADMSEELQKWIFSQYIVMNGLKEESSIIDIFSDAGLVPPGGTGDCAAPKLLDYAFRHGLEPIAMGEFWYGASPDTAVRTAGHFYPSCTSKCGPLLKYMLRGMTVSDDMACEEHGNTPVPSILFEDDEIIVVDKPSGMPSVPGLDGRESVQEWLGKRLPAVHAVHRLDMDTSGVIIYAKTAESAVDLRRQFEERRVHKTYRALLQAGTRLSAGDCGTIDLPLSPDYDERPRQKVDFKQGKQAVTEYKVISVHPDGTAEVIFQPVTGRTHQLRVHSAHHLGLGCPIVGDLLYGANAVTSQEQPPGRLFLHAEQISFIHPVSGHKMKCKAQSRK